MTAPAHWAVIIDPLGMANVVSGRQPGPGVAGVGLTGEWRRDQYWRWMTWGDAVESMREWNYRHSPARPGEGGEP